MKRYAAFLSFATPDRVLVKNLSELFRSIDLDVYFAPEGLPRRGSEAWRAAILDAIRESHCIIPVLTPQSIKRAWVLYEIGAADCIGLPIIKGRTAGVSPSDLQKMPGTDAFAYSLGDEDNLRDLILKVCEISKGNKFRNNVEGLIDQVIQANENSKIIRALSVKRKVFIGGSVPSNKELLNKMSVQEANRKEDDLLAKIVKEITVRLLDNGFIVSSCPDVSVVGRTVAEGAFEWCEKKGKELSEVYSMQGMLFTSDERLTEEALVNALRHGFISTRKKYLKDHEFFIVIGGNERAELECKAARELGTVKLLPIGCFGGTALKVSEDASYECVPFTVKEWSSDSCNMLLEAMKNV